MAGAKKGYIVQSPVDHDGQRYEIGEPIDLEDKHAKALLEAGAIAEAKAKKAKDQKPDDGGA